MKINKILILLTVIIINAVFINADGFIVIPDPIYSNNPFPLEVKFHRVNVEINDMLAITMIDQIFYNPTKARLEGQYIFPIPKNAVIKKFSMYINGKETKAELLNSDQAKKIYEDIVRKQKDPALLEYIDGEIYKIRIFPIEPNSENRIKIEYAEVLTKDNGTIEYLYPLNTEKFSSKELKNVSINVNIKTSDKIKNIYCTTHDTETVYKNENNAIVSYEEHNVKPDNDFRLFFNTSNSLYGISLLTNKEDDKNKFFFLNISPGIFNIKEDIEKKDITFVLDTSGSMSDKKIEQLKKAILFCITNLNSDDRFDIIRFSTDTETLFGTLKDVNQENINTGKKFINSFQAIGGTNIEDALILAVNNSKNSNNHIIIFVTDGKPTINETDENKLIDKIKKANVLKTRIFTFGIGDDINIHLLDKLTKETNANRTYINTNEDIEVKISSFFQKIQYPVLSNIKIYTSNNISLYNYYPEDLPDLFYGSSLTLIGKYKGNGEAKIALEGYIKNQFKKVEFTANFIDQDDYTFIQNLWASRRVGFLLDQIRLNGEQKELVDEIVFISKRYGVISPYTSYLIVEDEINRTNRGDLKAEDQILNQMTKDTDISKNLKKEYNKMKEKSGYDSIEASKEVQDLNQANNTKQTKQGEDRLQYNDKKGSDVNIYDNIKNIQNRAFYQVNGQWIDSYVNDVKINKINKIKFASQEYFDLIKKYKNIKEILSLGKNIKFIFNNEIFVIYE